MLQSAFVPSNQSLNNIYNTIKSKFAFVDTIKTYITSVKNMLNNTNAIPTFTIDVPNNRFGISSITILDLNWYAPYKNYGDLVITAFTYLFFLWRLWCNIPNILHGVSSSTNAISGFDNLNIRK